jgi:hypothetical protein
MQVCLERKKKENIIKWWSPFEGYTLNRIPYLCKRELVYTAFKVKDIRVSLI